MYIEKFEESLPDNTQEPKNVENRLPAKSFNDYWG